jgi:hypothetical protein
VATLTDERGKVVWKRRRFFNRQADLVALSAAAGPAEELTVVIEPTRNSWVLVAAHFRAQGAKVVLVAPNRLRTCAVITTSTPRTTTSTRNCWPVCRCCTPTGWPRWQTSGRPTP